MVLSAKDRCLLFLVMILSDDEQEITRAYQKLTNGRGSTGAYIARQIKSKPDRRRKSKESNNV